MLLLYPFAIYFGLHYFSHSHLVFFILALLLARVAMLKDSLKKMPWVLPASVLGAIAVSFSFFFDSLIGFKLYPLMVNIAMLSVFYYSYLKPPTVIETFARLTEKNFPEQAVNYTEKVTLAWCVFFSINGCISLYTALYTSLDMWVLYNGLLSYLGIASFMGIEYLIRRNVKKQHSVQLQEQSNLNSKSNQGSSNG